MARCCLPAPRPARCCKADAEVELDGHHDPRRWRRRKEKAAKADVLELLPSDKPFEAVTQQLAKRDRSDRGDRSQPRRPPRPATAAATAPRATAGHVATATGPRVATGEPARAVNDLVAIAPVAPRPDRGPRPDRRSRPSFSAPPELPQRPKPKRLKPGRAHRNAVLADLPEEQRPSPSARCRAASPPCARPSTSRTRDCRSEGKPEMPAAGLLAMAEQLLPELRVAEWLDRADAAIGRYRRARPARPAQRRGRRRGPDGRSRRDRPARSPPS